MEEKNNSYRELTCDVAFCGDVGFHSHKHLETCDERVLAMRSGMMMFGSKKWLIFHEWVFRGQSS